MISCTPAIRSIKVSGAFCVATSDNVAMLETLQVVRDLLRPQRSLEAEKYPPSDMSICLRPHTRWKVNKCRTEAQRTYWDL